MRDAVHKENNLGQEHLKGLISLIELVAPEQTHAISAQC